MIKKRNWLVLSFVTLLTLIISYILIRCSVIDIDKVIDQEEDFQYNAISMSSIIGGFLLTEISLLISMIDKPRIQRLWESNYLDNIYRAAFIGMISNIITIISALIYLTFNISEAHINAIVSIEITTLIIGIVFFSWCVVKSISIIRKMKSGK